MAEYFSHDYNARNDVKLKRLFMHHGVAGIGIYWCIVEMLYESGGELPIGAEDVIAYDLRTEAEIVKSVICDFDLFVFTDETFTSTGVKKRLDMRTEQTEKRKQAAKARWDKLKESEETMQTDASAMHMHSKCNASAMHDYTSAMQTDANKTKLNEMKLNEMKGNEIKDNSLITVSNDTVCSTEVERIVTAWNDLPSVISKIIKITAGSKRDKMIKARLKDYSVDEILSAISEIRKSDFLLGKGQKGWVITFDWFILPTNFQKVLEGNYRNRTGARETEKRPLSKAEIGRRNIEALFEDEESGSNIFNFDLEGVNFVNE